MLKVTIPHLPRRVKTRLALLFVASLLLPLLTLGCQFLADIVGHGVPLYTAAQEGRWREVETRLAQGADPNETTDLQNDRTALFWAVYFKRADMARLLITKGVNVNKVDTHGETALDWANLQNIRGDNAEVVGLLRHAGAKYSSEL